MTLCSESLGNMFQENAALISILGHLLGAQFWYLDMESVLLCVMFLCVCVCVCVCVYTCVHTHACVLMCPDEKLNCFYDSK